MLVGAATIAGGELAGCTGGGAENEIVPPTEREIPTPVNRETHTFQTNTELPLPTGPTEEAITEADTKYYKMLGPEGLGLQATPLSPDQIDLINEGLNRKGPELETIPAIYEPLNNGFRIVWEKTTDPENARLLIPFVQLSPEIGQLLRETVRYMLDNAPGTYLTIFHFTQRMGELGVNPRNLIACNHMINALVREAVDSGTVWIRPATEEYQGAYIAISNLFNKPWAVVLDAETGAPITMFRTNSSDPTMVTHAAKTGAELIQGEVPEVLRKWTEGSPSVLKTIYWALKYQVETRVGSLAEKAAESGSIPLIVKFLETLGMIATHGGILLFPENLLVPNWAQGIEA